MAGFVRAQAKLRPVPGFEDTYAVSNGGAIFRWKEDARSRVGKRLRQYPDRNGYLHVTLRSPGRQQNAKVHQVVAEAFIGPRIPGVTVNHIDMDLCNNSAANLEYMSPGDNSRHAAGYGRRCGEMNANAKLTRGDVVAIRRQYSLGITQQAIADKFGISQVQVSHIVRRAIGGWQSVKGGN